MGEPQAVKELLKTARQNGGISASEAVRLGIHSQTLTRLVRKGKLERIARGFYRLPGFQITEHHTLSIVARLAPDGVVCLLSALSFHGIGTQIPSHVWLAVPRSARPPRIAYPPVRIVKFSGASFSSGIERHPVEGRTVKVYSVAKTIADLFKYRNRIGMDVVLEALREAWRNRRFSMDELDEYAEICRVKRVIAPFLEALAA
jgi:predicted transcriptional regulator of viral defense system